MTKQEWIDSLSKEILNCSKCERLRLVTPYPMSHICYGDNLSKVKMFVVGRNPGNENDCSSIPHHKFMKEYHRLWWICHIGKYMRGEFGDNFIKENIFFTNLCKCVSPQNTVLTDIERENCLHFLQSQVKVIRPRIIVTFGVDAKRYVGKIHANCDIINLIHPAAFKYSASSGELKRQSEKIALIKRTYEEESVRS